MDLNLLIYLFFFCVLNIIFFFSGVVLNALVIITILKTTQLRKKLCHFMIMVLSCCDLLTVVIHSSALILYSIVWFTDNNDLYETVRIYRYFSNFPAGLSLLTLMVMCIERYIGVYYPIFHKTSVTRRRLLTLLAIYTIPLTALIILISTTYSVISRAVGFSIFMAMFLPSFIFFNYKLFKISRKIQRQNATSSERRRISLKHINTCLLAVASLVFWSVPFSVFVVFRLVEGSTSENARLSLQWATATLLMNCSFNSLIFFWKNKILRDEGIKIIKKIKNCVLGS